MKYEFHMPFLYTQSAQFVLADLNPRHMKCDNFLCLFVRVKLRFKLSRRGKHAAFVVRQIDVHSL